MTKGVAKVNCADAWNLSEDDRRVVVMRLRWRTRIDGRQIVFHSNLAH